MPTEDYKLYGGDVTLMFNEAKHKYTVIDPEKGLDNAPLVSTTSVTKVIDKPALIFWAVNEAMNWLQHQWRPGRAYGSAQIAYLLKQAKFAHKNVSKTATDIGTEVHAWIERFADAVIAGMEDPHRFPLPAHEGVLSGVTAFLSWYDAHDVKIIASEKKVYSRKHTFSGTFDLLATVDGVLSVVDFKTSKRIYPEYFLQSSAYAVAYDEEQAYIRKKNGDTSKVKRVSQIIVLRVPKDGSDFEAGSSTDVRGHFKTFLSCLDILKWQSRQ